MSDEDQKVRRGAGMSGLRETVEAWDALDAKRRARRRGHLDGIPLSLPSLQRAQRVSARAATVGFDWPTAAPVLEKVEEELGEVREALASGDAAALEAEIGDLLFSAVNLARKCGVQAEEALRGTVERFEARFRYMEAQLEGSGRTAEEASLEELEALWQEAKVALKGGR